MFVKTLYAVERALSVLACVTIVVIMLVVVSDVVMRYVFHMPWPWAYDVITIYLMILLFYPGFPLANAQRANIAIDILHHYIGQRFRHAVAALTGAIALLLFFVIGWVIYGNLATEISTNEVVQGYYDYPTFVASLIIVVASILICIRSLIQTGMHIASVVTGRDICSLSKIPGEE